MCGDPGSAAEPSAHLHQAHTLHYLKYTLPTYYYKLHAFQQIHARGRPKRGLAGAHTALAGPSATCHHPQASPALIGAASEPPRSRRGALTVAISRHRHPKTGHNTNAPLSDLTTTPRASAAAPRAPRTALTALHALPSLPGCLLAPEAAGGRRDSRWPGEAHRHRHRHRRRR